MLNQLEAVDGVFCGHDLSHVISSVGFDFQLTCASVGDEREGNPDPILFIVNFVFNLQNVWGP